MKKFCINFLILAIIFLVSSVMAQNNQIGPLVGLNLASMDVDLDDEELDIDTSMRTCFAFGGVFYLSLSPNIGFQIEPAYVQKGSKVVVKEMDDDHSFKMEQTVKVNYIDIPILFKASFGQGSTKPYILAGPDIAFKIGDAIVETDKVTVDGQDITNLIPSDELEQELETKSTDFGLNFGAGILFPLGTNHFFIEGQYNIGLTNINDEDPDETDIKTKGIQIKVGIFFPLGR